MKAKAVSALREQRWVPRVWEAWLSMPGTMNRKQNTMKTYILRDPQSVQPQKARLVERPDPQNGALVERSGTAGGGPALYVGLDVHTDSIAVSLAPSDATEVRR